MEQVSVVFISFFDSEYFAFPSCFYIYVYEFITLYILYVYVLGMYNDVWSSGDGGKTWVSVTSAASWSIRNRFGVVVYNSNIIVMGGYGGASKCSIYNNLYIYIHI